MSNFPTCQVCHQPFFLKGPAPLLLPCLHAVCETCVTAAAGGVVSCCTCQRAVNLTETRLQKDVITEKEVLLLTVNNNPELVLCTHEEDGNQAVCWCKECEDFFCENCQMVHNSFRGARMHSLQNMGELEVDTYGELKYCTVHPNFPADTLDEDCKMFTCSKCRRGDHSEHRVVFVEEVADIARKQLITIQKDVNSTIDKHGAHLAAAEESLQTSEQTYRMLPDKISHTFHSLATVIDQRGKELQVELQQQNEKSGEDEIKMKRSETCLKRCKVLSEYITKTLQYCSMHDLLDLSSLLETIALDNISSAPSGDYQPCPLPVFNIQGLEILKSTLANFGCITTEDDLFISQTKDTGTQTEEDSRLEWAAEEIKQLKSAHEKLTREKENAEESPIHDLEKDVQWWEMHHHENEVTKENVGMVLADLFMTHQLKERLLEERKGDFLMKRHEELKKEYSRQQAEVERLKIQRIKPRPLVSLHILSAWQSLPVEEIARRISVVLERQKIDMRFNVVTDPAEVTTNSRPLLVLCINNSRLQTDVSNALKDIQVDDGVCLVVLHHKDQISRPVRSSQKLLSTTEFRSLGAVADMQFWRKKEVYSCGQNGAGAEKIADYLVRYARPGFQ